MAASSSRTWHGQHIPPDNNPTGDLFLLSEMAAPEHALALLNMAGPPILTVGAEVPLSDNAAVGSMPNDASTACDISVSGAAHAPLRRRATVSEQAAVAIAVAIASGNPAVVHRRLGDVARIEATTRALHDAAVRVGDVLRCCALGSSKGMSHL